MCRERESIGESERGLHAGAKDVIPVGVQGPKWVNVWVLMDMNVLLCGWISPLKIGINAPASDSLILSL